MIMRIFKTIIATLLLCLATIVQGKVKIVASSSDLASVATHVGKDLVEVTSIGQGKSNLHFVEILPSYMLKVARADIYLKVGLSLDQWAQGVIDGARNNKLIVVDCSKGVAILDKPSGKIDASMGDLHPEGNPHYWLDPRNGKLIADNIVEALCKADAANAATYRANRDAFNALVDQKWSDWVKAAEAFKGAEVITYHSTFDYLAHAFGFTAAGYIEPKPGIEPTAAHNTEMIKLIKTKHIHAILRDPYYSRRAPESIARATGAIVYEAPSSVGGTVDAKDYISLFDTLVSILAKGVK
jgi:ABC-type Zn uptake system ZnuABC Zn-binding protein ZnuA